MNNTYLDQLVQSASSAIAGANGGGLQTNDDNLRLLLEICRRQQDAIAALVSKIDLLETKLGMTDYNITLINQQIRSMT